MALQKSYDHESGINLPNAYHKVSNVSYDNADSGLINFSVSIYADSSARLNGNPSVTRFSYGSNTITGNVDSSSFEQYFSISAMDATNANIVKNVYEYMKTQSDINGVDYTDSTDV